MVLKLGSVIEYQDRIREVNFYLENSQRYSSLRNELRAIELLLALSIFYKRIIANLEGTIKFYGTVTRVSEADTIQIGNYYFTLKEKNNLQALTINYHSILEKYHISENIFNYYDTRDFIESILNLKNYADNE